MLAKRKNKRNLSRGGGSVQQPLAYLDPSEVGPNASAGSDLLKQQGLIVRPVIGQKGGSQATTGQRGGASVQQPLAYLDPTLPVPSASAGSNLLVQDGLILRPRIGGSRGGFIPSVMKGVVNSAVVVGPLAAIAAKRMWYDTRKKGGFVGPSHPTSGGGKKEDWSRNREAAKEELSKYGKPSGLNINKYAALKRKDEEEAEDWLTDYIVKKRKTAKKGDKKTKNKTEKKPKAKKVKKAQLVAKEVKVETAEMWGELLARAKRNLEPFGKPSGPNVTRFASMKKQGLNTAAFLANYKTRKQYKEPVFTPRNQYQANLQEARKYLSQFGKPTVANVSKFVSMKRKGEATTAVENAVKGRVKPVTVKPASVKPTAHSPPAVAGPPYPAAGKSNWATAYSKAKANLTSIRAKPKAYQIATLAGLRRKGENNTKFLQSYRGEK